MKKIGIIGAMEVEIASLKSAMKVSRMLKKAQMEFLEGELEGCQAVVVRRDTREKIEVALDELEVKVPEILETIQKDMYERAKKHRDAHIWDAHNYDEFKDIAENKPGFIRGMWCEDRACEDKIKEELAVTSRCMPFEDQEQISDVCVCCGKPAHKLVYWGKAY